jgi:hypothetical protein
VGLHSKITAISGIVCEEPDVIFLGGPVFRTGGAASATARPLISIIVLGHPFLDLHCYSCDVPGDRTFMTVRCLRA